MYVLQCHSRDTCKVADQKYDFVELNEDHIADHLEPMDYTSEFDTTSDYEVGVNCDVDANSEADSDL